MNNEMIFFLLYGVLCAVFGHFAYRVYFLINGIMETKRRKQVYASLEKATTDNCCKGPHTYDRIQLAMAEIPVDTYLVCTDCGFVSNDVGLYKLNGPAMEIYKNELNRRKRSVEIEIELNRRKNEKIQEAMNRLVRSSIEGFDGDMHKNIPELQQFYRKTALELESIYAGLKKDLDELERG